MDHGRELYATIDRHREAGFCGHAISTMTVLMQASGPFAGPPRESDVLLPTDSSISSRRHAIVYRDLLSQCTVQVFFASGRVQIAGCHMPSEIVWIGDELCSMWPGVRISGVRTSMVSVNFDVGGGLHLTRVFENAPKARFRDSYAGLTLSFPEHGATCQTFATGKAQLVAPTLEDAAAAYDALVPLLEPHVTRSSEYTKKKATTWTEVVRRVAPDLLHLHPPSTTPHTDCPRCQHDAAMALLGVAFSSLHT